MRIEAANIAEVWRDAPEQIGGVLEVAPTDCESAGQQLGSVLNSVNLISTLLSDSIKPWRNRMNDHGSDRRGRRLIAIAVCGLLLLLCVYPIARRLQRVPSDLAGQGAVQYVLLHVSVSYDGPATTTPTASQITGVSVPADRFGGSMIDNLLELPNLKTIAIRPYPPINGPIVEASLNDLALPAKSDDIAKLHSRFPSLRIYYQPPPNSDGG